MARALSGKGQGQAELRRKILGNPKFDLILSSPAARAVQTALIVSDQPESTVQKMHQLCWTEGSDFAKAIDAMFRELGYKPLADYRKHPQGHLLDEQAGETWTLFQAFPFSGKSALITGHAVMSNALACQAIGGYDPSEWRYLSETSFGECEGVTLEFRTGEFVGMDVHV